MKVSEVIVGKQYTSTDGLIVQAVKEFMFNEHGFAGIVIKNSPDNPKEFEVGRKYSWLLDKFSPLSEKEYEAPRSIQKNEVKEERQKQALREIRKLLNNKFIKSITFSNKVYANETSMGKIKVKFTFIHNKIKFDSLQAIQDTISHLHELNNEL